MNIVNIKNTEQEKTFESQFVEVAQDKNYIVIDIEAIATHIGRDIADDNYDVERKDISSSEVWAHVTIFTDEIAEVIRGEVEEYLDNNL